MTVALTALDVFAGCGGSSYGFRRAGFRIVGAIDNDPTACESYRHNVGVGPRAQDVRQVTGRQLLSGTGVRAGQLTVLIGCPPCQGFTFQRRESRKGWDPRNRLLDEFVRLVGETRPAFIVMENVPGLVKGSGSWRLQRAVRRLRNELGYFIDMDVVEAADYGVPQFRRRLLLIGSRVTDAIRLPKPTHGDPASVDVIAGRRRPWRTVRDAIASLNRLDSGQSDPADSLHAARVHSILNLRRLAAIPHDGGGRESLKGELILACHRGHDGHRDVYGRMWWDRPAPTLTSGCTNMTRGRFAHPNQDRAITVREALLLQGFPVSAVARGTAEQAALQVGNAVPPPLAAAAARQVAWYAKSAGRAL